MTPIAPPTAALRDFPDWLSPILVKELRQGLRQRAFVLLFVFLQVIMVLVVFSALLGGGTRNDEGLRAGETISGFFFALFAIAGLLVQPLRAINALAGERTGGTLDLLTLTRLSVWRITVGKWLALFGQTTLLLIAILPYLLMRYYLGGMQLFNELLLLFALYVLSGAVTAIMVGISGLPSVVLRVILGLALAFPLFGLTASIFQIIDRGMGRFIMNMGMGTSTSGFVWAYLGAMAVVAFLGYYFLEIGATQLAPPSENRSTRKRLMGLAMLAVILFGFKWAPEAAVVVGFFLAVLLVLDALTESPEFTVSVMRPFRRFGLAGRAAAMLLAPGRATGTLFAGVVIGLVLLGFSQAIRFHKEEGLLGFGLLGFASLLMPAYGVALAKRGQRNSLVLFLAVAIGAGVISLVLTILGYAMDGEKLVPWLFFLLPPLGLMGINELYREEAYTTCAALTLFGWWLLLLLAGNRWFARMSRLQESPPRISPPAPADDA